MNTSIIHLYSTFTSGENGNPSRAHWNAVKHVLRYLVGIKVDNILFGLNETSDVDGYTDLDFIGCDDS